jgi:radical SAM protein with 4Fe4S-binding SPASM domain
MILWDEMPDVEAPRRKYHGRCPECRLSMGCAPGCPNEEVEESEVQAENDDSFELEE